MDKLYIAVLDEVPAHMVPVCVAHATLGSHLAFIGNVPGYATWLQDSFKKVVVKVNRKEFAKIAALENVYLSHENKTLNGEPCVAVVAPRVEYPNVIKFAKLYEV